MRQSDYSRLSILTALMGIMREFEITPNDTETPNGTSVYAGLPVYVIYYERQMQEGDNGESNYYNGIGDYVSLYRPSPEELELIPGLKEEHTRQGVPFLAVWRSNDGFIRYRWEEDREGYTDDESKLWDISVIPTGSKHAKADTTHGIRQYMRELVNEGLENSVVIATYKIPDSTGMHHETFTLRKRGEEYVYTDDSNIPEADPF